MKVLIMIPARLHLFTVLTGGLSTHEWIEAKGILVNPAILPA